MKKKIYFIGICIAFVIYAALISVVMERPYSYIESIVKEISSKINYLIINNMYTSKYTDGLNIMGSREKYLEKENKELKDILSLKVENNGYVSAEVTNHNLKNWFNKIGINEGYKRNIKKGDPVINKGGIVGFVSKTSKNHSEVNLITNVNEENLLSVLIMAGDKNVFGVLRNYDVKKHLFKITDVTYKGDSLKGCKVILTGYDNPKYKGIYVGKIVKEEEDNYGLTKTLWLKSEADFDNLLFLMVVTDK